MAKESTEVANANPAEGLEPKNTSNRKLPTLNELYADKPAIQKQSDLAALVNCSPKSEWLAKHPFIKREVTDDKGKKQKVPHEYLPIERVEYLLTSVFRRWYVEVKEVKLLANSVCVTVRLCYQDPLTMEIHHQDGIGAAPLRTGSGKGALDFNALQDSAVQTGAPAAESYAVKDAAEKIGRLFGRDLNRAHGMQYGFLTDQVEKADLGGFDTK